MRKIYHLSTCNTCQRIIRELSKETSFQLQDIKTHPISPEDLDWAKNQLGSYEALFNRRAQKYRQMGLHLETLNEDRYRELILSEYTFLKRPLILIGQEVFAGNSKLVVEAAKKASGKH